MNSHELTPASQWILDKYIKLGQDIDLHMSSYEVSHAIEGIYRFLWDNYAQWYVEYLKTAPGQIAFAKELYREFIITVSPFIPFEAEVLWREFFGEHHLLAHYVHTVDFINQYSGQINPGQVAKFESLILIISSIRSTRGLFAIDPVTPIVIHTQSERILNNADFIAKNSKAKIKNLGSENLYSVTISDVSYAIDILNLLTDHNKEITRTQKIITDLQKQKQALESQLGNEQFIQNAGETVVAEKRKNLSDRESEIAQQESKLAFLSHSERTN